MLKLESSSFEHEGKIPARYTCDGDDLSPALSWSGVPDGTRSLALVVDDPDAPDPSAPQRTWVHWVLYDIPRDATGIPEGATAWDMPPGTRQGRNDWGRTGYGGPCPPIGAHRYFHKLYALDVRLGDRGPLGKRELEAAIAGHVLGYAEIYGTYERPRRKGERP